MLLSELHVLPFGYFLDYHVCAIPSYGMVASPFLIMELYLFD